MKRTFVAIPFVLSPAFLNFYSEVKNKLKGKINWVKPENMHLTLAFIGKTSPETEQAVKSAILKTSIKTESFNLLPERLEVFPSGGKPRVLWTGLNKPAKLIDLRNKLWENFQPPIDLKDDNNKFKAHLTLARIKWLDDREVLNNLLNRYQRISFPEMQVDRIIYYESKLSESGPTYYKIGSYFLK
jgi:2'-5' RNA ligase